MYFSLVLTALLSRIYDDTKRAKKIFLALIGLLPTNHIIAYITMALTEVFENTLNNVKYLKFYCQNWVESTEEMATFGDYPGDSIL